MCACMRARASCTPKEMLLGFVRTQLLQPGDAETVCISINLSTLRLMAPDGDSFGLLPGEYNLSVGGSPPGKNGVFVESTGPDKPPLAFTLET